LEGDGDEHGRVGRIDHRDRTLAGRSDAREALDFYRNAFGAVEAYRLDDDDGRPVVAQLSIGGAAFWIQDDADASPVAPGVGSVRMILSVGDPDALFERAVAAGAAPWHPCTTSTGGARDG
jgi:PhnB protein